LKVTYTEDAIADIVEAISYLNERNPTAAANLDAEIAQCIDRLVAQEFDGPVSRLRSGISCDVGPSRRFASTTSASPTSCWSFASITRRGDPSRDNSCKQVHSAVSEGPDRGWRTHVMPGKRRAHSRSTGG
jgi:plasmid stabilization system protein ParE